MHALSVSGNIRVLADSALLQDYLHQARNVKMQTSGEAFVKLHPNASPQKLQGTQIQPQSGFNTCLLVDLLECIDKNTGLTAFSKLGNNNIRGVRCSSPTIILGTRWSIHLKKHHRQVSRRPHVRIQASTFLRTFTQDPKVFFVITFLTTSVAALLNHRNASHRILNI
jgi:hypothetical protein